MRSMEGNNAQKVENVDNKRREKLRKNPDGDEEKFFCVTFHQILSV